MNLRTRSLEALVFAACLATLGCEAKDSSGKDALSDKIEVLEGSLTPTETPPRDFNFDGTWESEEPTQLGPRAEKELFSFEVKKDRLLIDQRELALIKPDGEAHPTLCLKLKTGNPSCDSFRLIARTGDKIYFTSGFFEQTSRPISMKRGVASAPGSKPVADSPPPEKR